MRRIIGALFAAGLAFAGPASAADTPLAAPLPSWEQPRKILLQLTDDDPRKVNSILSNAINLQKFYTQDLVRIAIVAYGPGVRAFLANSPAAERVASVQHYDIELIACGNTLTAIGSTATELSLGVAVATAGIAEIVERRLAGWTYIVP